MEDSRGIWKAMKNPVDKRVKLPHDGYLKIFQLESPCLQVTSLVLKNMDFMLRTIFILRKDIRGGGQKMTIFPYFMY